MTEMLSSLFLNIDGNATNFDQFCAELKCISHTFTAIGIAETNTYAQVGKTYKIPSYKEYYQEKNESKKSGSGVALYIHESIKCSAIDEISECTADIECLFMRSTNLSVPVTFGVVYRPNDGDKDIFCNKLENIFNFLPRENVYILGDYNINLLAKTPYSKYEDCIMSSGYIPSISTYTHERPGSSRSCIDNILVNSTHNLVLSGTLSDKLSHHLPIFTFSNFSTKSSQQCEKHVQYYDYCNKNLNNFIDELEQVIPSLENTTFSQFSETYKFTLDKHCKLKVPKTTKRNVFNNPWITEGIIEAIERKYELKNDWVKTITKNNPDGDQNLYNIFSLYRKTLKHIINQAKKSFKCSQIHDCKEDRKKTWKIINELRGTDKKLNVKPPFIIDNKKVIDRRKIANAFNKYFVSVASKLNDGISDLQISDSKFESFTDFLNPSNVNSIFLEDCTKDEVSEIISEFQNGKASDIPIKVIKKSSHVISKKLSEFFSSLMNTGIFPEELKIGKITPVFKKGDSKLLENYRPISTLPIFGKIFEKIIYKRLYNFLSSQSVLHENQYGFRKSHSTSHALNYSISHIGKKLKLKKHVLGIFIDLSKAFDTIDHEKLLDKLYHCGIRGAAHSLLKTYLSNRHQKTEVLGSVSENLVIQYGVPQGSVLGPLLFLIYINDLVNCSKLGEFVLFADDTNIFVSGNSVKEAYCKANILLSSLHQYMVLNKLHVNKSKCCYIHFKSKIRSGNNEINEIWQDNLKAGGHKIKKVSETKFLGVTIDEKLCWNSHIQDCTRKLNYATATLSRIKDCIPENLHKDLYHTLFESHLSYGITVWGGIADSKLSQLHKIQKKCIRIMFGDRQAYLDKFKTCVRAREYDKQALTDDFYKKRKFQTSLSKA